MGVALSPFTLRQSNIVKAAEPLPTGFVAGDVDGSKKVDLSDIVSLAQYVAGWQVEYSENLEHKRCSSDNPDKRLRQIFKRTELRHRAKGNYQTERQCKKKR
jgi:hypothetical protein